MAGAGFRERIRNFFSRKVPAEESFFEDLEDLLVEGDFGAAEAYTAVESLRELCRKERVSESDSIRQKLAVILEEQLRTVNSAPAGDLLPGSLTIILLLGVNGVGKTTTAAKLADRYRQAGRRPILAAADTFRAAAVDQLKIHGERLGIRVVAHKQGGDPAAVVYDAVEAAQAGAGDLIIADTAGRMHTKAALVEELRKIDRVVASRTGLAGPVGDARYIRWLVLDATTGRNALAQAEIFHQAVPLKGVILTKCDSTARGGAVFSLASSLKLPVVYLCSGEAYGDIEVFDPRSYAEGFLGLER
ncbi:MAG: signal recognition particle-docking protein FtsY [Treponema sp.]|jgi:fused signal recognition particle receptor|nr:signal recognition particle-docking protein FtsY [Treponema sp.]